ncbi:MAG TPA: tetratricopeptide repeat protein [Pontiella sp.]
MKNRKITLGATGTLILLATFSGCGERTGERDYNKAVAAWEKGNLVKARVLFEKSIRKTSGNEKKSFVLNQLGLVLWELGEANASANAFTKSCHLTENLTGANLNQGIALLHSGRLEEAEVVLNNVLGDDPNNQTARTLLGLVVVQRKKWEETPKELIIAIKQDPQNPITQTALALSELKRDRQSAVNRLKLVTKISPEYAPAMFNLGIIYDQVLNNPEEALIWYKKYLKQSHIDPVYRTTVEQAIARLNDSHASDRVLEKPKPSTTRRYLEQAAKLHSAKKYAEAIQQYKKAIQADPKQKSAYYNMSLAYYSISKYQEASQACISALKIDPLFTDARYMLTLSYAKQAMWNIANREANELAKLDKERGEQMKKYIADMQQR